MKRLLFVVFLFISYVSLAQDDVTKFLGIPVDGTKTDMIQKLKEKGYTYNSQLDCLEGEFNGYNVRLHVVTNNNKVYRILVEDAFGVNETAIKIRFNNLCRQFGRNSRYSGIKENQEIPDNEDISYEMIVNNKRYEAIFYQTEMTIDTDLFKNTILEFAKGKISENELAELSDSEKEQLVMVVLNEYQDEFKEYYVANNPLKIVWFTIAELYGDYRIAMYYDNEKNKSNGEDL